MTKIHQVKSLHHHWSEFGLVTLRMKIGRKFPDPKTNFQGIFLVFLDAVKGIRNIISSKADNIKRFEAGSSFEYNCFFKPTKTIVLIINNFSKLKIIILHNGRLCNLNLVP